jgi:hypothetical protein
MGRRLCASCAAKPDSRTPYHGQTLVELAVALPILLMVMLGTVNLGLLMSSQLILTQAAWEGARAGATLGDPDRGDAEIIAAVQQAASGLDTSRLAIEIQPSEHEYPRDQPWPMPRGQPLTVTLAYPMTLHLPFAVDVSLGARAVSRMEYQNP